MKRYIVLSCTQQGSILHPSYLPYFKMIYFLLLPNISTLNYANNNTPFQHPNAGLKCIKLFKDSCSKIVEIV